MNERIAVIGLGYVGLPVALAFARKVPETVGFDGRNSRADSLSKGIDETGESTRDELLESTIQWSSDPQSLRDATFFAVAVPTPVDSAKRPDLVPLVRASETVGRV